MAKVGLVVVSHSRALAEAAVELALIMVPGEPPTIEIAAGTEYGGFGTDATAVFEAIMQADQGDGVLVFVDLGSAITSADFALEMLADMGEEVELRVLAAPFVEGLTAAVVLAATGAGLEAIAAEAEGAMTPKLELLGEAAPAGGEVAADEAGVSADDWDVIEKYTVINISGLHARPASQISLTAGGYQSEIVLEKAGRQANAKSPVSIATLNAAAGDTVLLKARGGDAGEAALAIGELIATGFGEELAAGCAGGKGFAVANSIVSSGTVSGDTAVTGGPGAVKGASGSGPSRQGVSPGRAVGVVVKLNEVEKPSIKNIPETDIELERDRLSAALEEVATAYRQQADETSGEAREILLATAAFAADPVLKEGALQRIGRELVDPGTAMWESTEDLAAQLRDAGGLFAERVTDLYDVRKRVLARLGAATPGLGGGGEDVPVFASTTQPFVVVGRDLAPADAAKLPDTQAVGIVTQEGGPTSHTALLARAMGIPAVVGATDIMDVPAGTKVLVDGTTGEVIVNPTAEQAAGAITAPLTITPLTAPGATKDGHHVELLANIGNPAEAAKAATLGAEGIGLFRTEFAYLGRDTEPTVKEQATAYRHVMEAFAGQSETPHVVIRTLDAGSDKPLRFLGLPTEVNPALGVRGYRTSWLHPDVLKRQLEAIATGAPEAWVMAPMIATPEEAEAFRRLAKDGFGLKKVGVMVETPAAALLAEEIYQIVDFVSVGTNDLTQYTFAADRQSAELRELQDPGKPALLRLIAQLGEAATAAGKPLGVCGEAAGNPELAPTLVGLGVTSLSMTPRSLATVAEALAAQTLEQCQTQARSLL